jgi:hypothetical protein
MAAYARLEVEVVTRRAAQRGFVVRRMWQVEEVVQRTPP